MKKGRVKNSTWWEVVAGIFTLLTTAKDLNRGIWNWGREITEWTVWLKIHKKGF